MQEDIEVKSQEKLFSQEDVDKLIRENADKSFKAGLAKAQKVADERIIELETNLKQERALPKIRETFLKNGGNEKAFEDYLTKHRDQLLDADEKTYDKVIKKSVESTFWAFESVAEEPSDKPSKPKNNSLLVT